MIEPKPVADERGWFAEAYRRSDFVRNGIPFAFVQDNHSLSTAGGTLRGLHFQKNPVAQGMLIRCLVGETFDVAVDIRKGSPTFCRWVSVSLSAENHLMLWIPPGFAHGILTLTSSAEVAYKVTQEFSQHHDRVIRWNDPTIGINWPFSYPVLSMKDRDAPFLNDADNNFVYK